MFAWSASSILLQTAPDSISAGLAALATLGLPGPSILPPRAKLATAGNAETSIISRQTIILRATMLSLVVSEITRPSKTWDLFAFRAGELSKGSSAVEMLGNGSSMCYQLTTALQV